jgi:ABC-type transporter Mla subunit MlaD
MKLQRPNIKSFSKLNPKRLSVRTRRLSALLVVAAAAAIVVISSIGAGEKSGYQVRVLFKDSAGVAKGGNVRIAGANAGVVKNIFVSNGNLSSVVIEITDPAFQRFYADAGCRIRLQSLIGEKFVDCDPGTPTEPELRVDPTDPDRRLMLPNKTGSPVDVDQLLDAMREPQRERFRVIINELGVTLTGRGQDLQDILIRFDPTFKEVNDILRILAKENKNLETLAVDGDTSLKSLAANRKHITGLFKNADKAARATNVKRAELAETLARLPKFLDELEPTAKVLKNFANQAAPVAASARAAGTDLSTFVTGTNEFVAAANPALTKFGTSADIFRQQIPAIMPIADSLRNISDNRNSVTNLKKLLKSFENQDGYKNLAALTIGLAGSANGSDSFGHFIRSALVLNGSCLSYAQKRTADCASDFSNNRTTTNLPIPTKSSSKAKSSSTSSAAASQSSDAAALNYLMGSGK